jgi:hypothetical protein
MIKRAAAREAERKAAGKEQEEEEEGEGVTWTTFLWISSVVSISKWGAPQGSTSRPTASGGRCTKLVR